MKFGQNPTVSQKADAVRNHLGKYMAPPHDTIRPGKVKIKPVVKLKGGGRIGIKGSLDF